MGLSEESGGEKEIVKMALAWDGCFWYVGGSWMVCMRGVGDGCFGNAEGSGRGGGTNGGVLGGGEGNGARLVHKQCG